MWLTPYLTQARKDNQAVMDRPAGATLFSDGDTNLALYVLRWVVVIAVPTFCDGHG